MPRASVAAPEDHPGSSEVGAATPHDAASAARCCSAARAHSSQNGTPETAASFNTAACAPPSPALRPRPVAEQAVPPAAVEQAPAATPTTLAAPTEVATVRAQRCPSDELRRVATPRSRGGEGAATFSRCCAAARSMIAPASGAGTVTCVNSGATGYRSGTANRCRRPPRKEGDGSTRQASVRSRMVPRRPGPPVDDNSQRPGNRASPIRRRPICWRKLIERPRGAGLSIPASRRSEAYAENRRARNERIGSLPFRFRLALRRWNFL